MKRLSNNRELYAYLLSLRSRLQACGAGELSDCVDFAAAQAAGMSTEFVGESRIALRRVLGREAGILTAAERSDALNVLRQLDQAFNGYHNGAV